MCPPFFPFEGDFFFENRSPPSNASFSRKPQNGAFSPRVDLPSEIHQKINLSLLYHSYEKGNKSSGPSVIGTCLFLSVLAYQLCEVRRLEARATSLVCAREEWAYIGEILSLYVNVNVPEFFRDRADCTRLLHVFATREFRKNLYISGMSSS